MQHVQRHGRRSPSTRIPPDCTTLFPTNVRPPVSRSPNFRPRSSTSVLLNIESILYLEFYCSLDLTHIHSIFNQEDCFDWFRTPHYPALFHAAAAHRPLDYGS